MSAVASHTHRLSHARRHRAPASILVKFVVNKCIVHNMILQIALHYVPFCGDGKFQGLIVITSLSLRQ